MIQDVYARFQLNLSRVRNLLTLYQTQKKTKQGRKPIGSLDLLRAATVFLHASLEDFVRGLIVWRYPNLGPDVLDEVPLKGLSQTGRPEKFLLGRLGAFRGSLVEDVLEQSVEAYANTLTLNNTTDLVTSLKRIGVDTSPIQPHLSAIATLMERRHHIVHQADRNEKAGPGQQRTRSLGHHTVQAWTKAVEALVTEVCQALPPP